MFPSISAFTTTVSHTIYGSDQLPVVIETEINFTRAASQDDEFEFLAGLPVACLAPNFVNAVNARVRELNEVDPDTTFRYLA
jgi:hypothetical protein